MGKKIFNIAAIKKTLDKKPLFYSTMENDIIKCWNSRGHYSITIPKILFDDEILNNIPTQETELPQCISNYFKNISDDDFNIISHTFLTMELPNGINAYLYKNYKHNYFTPIDTNILKILNNIENYTPYQFKENTGIIFKHDTNMLDILIMPLHNQGIKEKLNKIMEVIQ